MVYGQLDFKHTVSSSVTLHFLVIDELKSKFSNNNLHLACLQFRMEKHEEDTLQKEQALQEVLENIDHSDFGEAGANRSDDSTLEAAYLVDGGLQDEDDIQGEERQQEPSRPSDSSEETVQNSEAVMVQNDRVRHRSPPLEILCVAKNLSYLEKTAELFPSDSDLSSFGMMTQSRSSGSALNSPLRLSSLSRPSSMRSDSGSEHGSWMSDVQSSVRNWNSVVLSSLEQANKNSVKIKSIQKGTSKRAVRMMNQTAKMQERMNSMQDSQQKMCDEHRSRLELLEQLFSKVTRWMDREAEYSTVKAKAALPAIPAYLLPQAQSITMTWVVPYANLVHSVQSIVSSKLQLPRVQGLQATLYLKGIGKGQGSHLSIGFRWVKTRKKQETTERYPVKITVQILNQADASETIEKRTVLVAFGEDESHSFTNDNLKNAIPKLIPISTVEDLSLGYQTDGRLLINITAEEVLCG